MILKTDPRQQIAEIATEAKQLAHKLEEQSQGTQKIISIIESLSRVVELDTRYIAEIKTTYLTIEQQQEGLITGYEAERARLLNPLIGWDV